MRRKRCCSISGRMVSNMSLQHWCTRGQLKEKDKIAPILAYTWTTEPAVSTHDGTPMPSRVGHSLSASKLETREREGLDLFKQWSWLSRDGALTHFRDKDRVLTAKRSRT
ncbi:hypothetical protein V6N13_135997 [Hibiscus sabdariffa]